MPHLKINFTPAVEAMMKYDEAELGGITNQFGVVCPQCRGAGEMMIGHRMDNCPRCDGYRYILLFWPRHATPGE